MLQIHFDDIRHSVIPPFGGLESLYFIHCEIIFIFISKKVKKFSFICFVYLFCLSI